MRRESWLLSSLIVVAGSVGADSPVQVGKEPGPRVESKAQTPKGPPAANVQGQPDAPASAVDPRATSLFRSAQNLEKSGKKPGAIGLYRDVLIRYPRSPEASESATRIRALGGKIPAPSEVNPAPPAETANFIRPPKPKYASQEANRAVLNQALGGMIGGAVSRPAPNGPNGSYQTKGPYAP